MSETEEKQSKLLWPILLIVTGAMCVGISWFYFKTLAPAPPPVLGEMKTPESSAPLSLITQEGKSFDLKAMAGKVWLINFFFTRCPGPCPFMSSQISGLLKKHPEIFALSITSDPEFDGVEVLKAYAAKYQANPTRWSFARGSSKAVQEFSNQVLKLPLGDIPDSHSARIVLLDQNGKIRGWFDSQSPDGIRSLSTSINRLK